MLLCIMNKPTDINGISQEKYTIIRKYIRKEPKVPKPLIACTTYFYWFFSEMFTCNNK